MEERIYLNDILNLPEGYLDSSKIKFNQYNGYEDPIELYKSNPERVNTEWLFWRKKKRFFSVGQIVICLLKLSPESWLLTTVKRVTKDLDVEDGVNYEGEELEELKPYFGRVIIGYRKQHQTQVIFTITAIDRLEVLQVLPSVYDGDNFPGYDNVCLTFSQLETIIKRGKRDWVAALENQKAVYLITDTLTGKLYVGAAYGDKGMLLQRWRNYVRNGHGGNVLLKELDFEYIKENFQYSILENYNSRVDDKFVWQRENWWKKVLLSRSGYNKN